MWSTNFSSFLFGFDAALVKLAAEHDRAWTPEKMQNWQNELLKGYDLKNLTDDDRQSMQKRYESFGKSYLNPSKANPDWYKQQAFYGRQAFKPYLTQNPGTDALTKETPPADHQPIFTTKGKDTPAIDALTKETPPADHQPIFTTKGQETPAIDALTKETPPADHQPIFTTKGQETPAIDALTKEDTPESKSSPEPGSQEHFDKLHENSATDSLKKETTTTPEPAETTTTPAPAEKSTGSKIEEFIKTPAGMILTMQALSGGGGGSGGQGATRGLGRQQRGTPGQSFASTPQGAGGFGTQGAGGYGAPGVQGTSNNVNITMTPPQKPRSAIDMVASRIGG